MDDIIKLVSTTFVVAKIEGGEWDLKPLTELTGQSVKLMTWTGSAVKSVDVEITSEPEKSEEVYKVYANGIRFRCFKDCAWPVIRNGLVSRIPASLLKAGDQLIRHPRFAKDAPHNLLGYQAYIKETLAQVKFAREDHQISSILVKNGGPILLGNGVFCG